MPLEKMLAALEAEATERLNKVKAEAKAEVESILKTAKEEAAGIKRNYFAEVRPRLSGELSRLAYEAKLARELELSREKEALLKEAFGQAAERLKAARKSQGWPEVQTRLIEEALGEVGGGELQVEIDPEDAALTRQVVARFAFKSKVATVPHWGGAVVRARDGKIVLDNTLETRWRRSTEILRREVLDHLLEG